MITQLIPSAFYASMKIWFPFSEYMSKEKSKRKKRRKIEIYCGIFSQSYHWERERQTESWYSLAMQLCSPEALSQRKVEYYMMTYKGHRSVGSTNAYVVVPSHFWFKNNRVCCFEGELNSSLIADYK